MQSDVQSSLGSRATPPPFRFVLQSYDKLCHLSMQLRWIDEVGNLQTWNSWKDSLCGYYEAMKLLPANSREIQASFMTMPAKHKVRKVNRRNQCDWCDGEEIFEWRTCANPGPEGLDVIFELRGPLLHCYIWRAWNRRNCDSPESWEYWPDFPLRGCPDPPGTLRMADLAAPWPGAVTDEDDEESHVVQVANALARLHAAVEVMLQVRRQTKLELQKLDKQLKKQWYRVNSGNSVAAGLAVASFATLFTVPPVGVALGIGSAAAGVTSTGSDMVGDHFRGSKFARTVQQDLYEQLGLTSVEAEMQTALQSAVSIVQASGNSVQARNRALALGGQTASIAGIALRSGVRAGRAVAFTRAGQGVSAAGKVLGGAGAVLAVGVAVYGWSSLKPNQKMVRQKLEEVNRSLDYLAGLSQQASGAVTCPLCKGRLHYGEDAIRRCEHFHCFHADCLREHADLGGQGQLCPLCPKTVTSKPLRTFGSSIEGLRAMLWMSGVKDCALNVESMGPQLLARGRTVMMDLAGRVREKGDDQFIASALDSSNASSPQSLQRKYRGHLPEDAETHEAWQDAMEAAGGLFEIEGQKLEGLIADGMGIPLKHRHRLWPRWLHVSERQSQRKADGCSFESLSTTSLPDDMQMHVNLDIPRTRQEFVTEAQHSQLRKVLFAWCSHSPAVGYAQGMNEIVAVFLKLGFDEENSFWMLTEVLEDLIPGCHQPGLPGLLRDIAVADVLVQSFLPNHAAAICDAGVQPVCLYADFFLTLGAKNSSLPLIARFWDFSFMHGPRALFSGLLAHLDLFFPVPLNGTTLDDEELIQTYRAASKNGDPEMFSSRLLYFLHETQGGGVSEQLIGDLRASLGQPRVCLETIPKHILAQGRDLMAWFTERAGDDPHDPEGVLRLHRRPMALDDVQPVLSRRLSVGMLPECASSHEAWQQAMELAGSIEAIDVECLERLVSEGSGMPLKYRLECWPAWLRRHERSTASLRETPSTIQPRAMSDGIVMQIRTEIEEIPPEVFPAAQHDALEQLVATAMSRNSEIGCTQGLSHLGCVFLKIGFAEDVALDMLAASVACLAPDSHCANLYGLFRDIAVADVLVRTFLPFHASAMSVLGIPLLWLTVDFFLSLGCKDARLPVSVRLLDLCFLFGPRALFCGLLALLELHFPLPSDAHKSRSVTEVLRVFHERCRNGDPISFVSHVRRFLHEHLGGVTAELVAGLREAVVDASIVTSTTQDFPASPTMSSQSSNPGSPLNGQPCFESSQDVLLAHRG